MTDTHFVAERLDENGRLYIYRTDSERDFIRHCISDHLAPLGAKVDVQDLGDRWMRIEITTPAVFEDNDGIAIADAIGNIKYKGWYECREEGQRDEPDGGFTDWCVVRHIEGPYW